ncbi:MULTISPECIES: bifunctional salicylyl-CoA 5-hydroxylase/oxidoreductase [unclassified Streptomyces]|uniref:bifunctional salicylyl-CoA 5-hydroxylase/oxidoreductase n=1 Tax=unclassified Streptomyces TaxID=2593676 RepID=UPI002E12EF6B|nr:MULTISPECIES: bifunctional salicylyl-CoA 5-hydroxylase/oxidoreductase [unclassified Streptomyces]WSR21702.1 bifunctional salicylyl-CoA 5-hydroxylase/oxidoreductase [Streptomyces sp. NBC_01205]
MSAGTEPAGSSRPALRVAVVGGGPGGLYAAALLARQGHTVEVWERGAPEDTFGFGVVLSDETLGGIERADTVVYAALSAEFVRWDDIDVVHRGRLLTSGGHGFAALGRRRLLEILHERCAGLGVKLRFRTAAPAAEVLAASYDLVIAADGVHSATRQSGAAHFRPTLTSGRCRYIWLAADFAFDAFRFEIAETEHGVMQLHAYPYSADGSTVIVEMHEQVWRAAGLDLCDEAESAARCAKIFGEALSGRPLHGNRSAWTEFRTVVNERWSHGNVVLLGDAAHTAHFSIGSGTKLAVEDALALAEAVAAEPDVPAALAAYESARRPAVASTQRAAAASMRWFEELAGYVDQPARQFAFNLLTRSRRVTHDNLRLRDERFTRAVERDFGCPDEHTPPMFTPLKLRGLTLRNRVVVSPMDMYSAADGDGTPGDFHLVHLGARALGGAALVMTEMVCVSPGGRITPGCTGLYTAEQAAAWTRIADFVHTAAPGTALGVQLGHSGRKGSTRLMWEGMDDPLPEGNWPVAAASELPYRPGVSAVPRALTVEDLASIRSDFAAAAVRAAGCGFDLLELHCAHGYLLSGFLSPLTNHRTDAYGGPLENRLRFPLEVFDAVRAVWPDDRPMTVRISATDWAPGGTSAQDAVDIAAAFAAHGADAIDVSTGQVVADETPEYGRSYQTPYADRIRNALGVPVIAVGAISSWDDVNSLLLAGRADLCAVGRPHLYDPHWTLHAAADQSYEGPAAPWPAPYRAGSRKPPAGRG